MEGDRVLESLPKVSVIIPVRNCEETIEDLLTSLMNVDYPKDRVEVILVDGQSTDNTVSIASKYPIKILQEPGLGPNYARKIGVEASTGEILAFTDGDCIVPKHWIKIIVENLSSPEVGCVGGSVYADKSIRNNIFASYADKSVMRVMPLAKKREVLSEPEVFKHLAFCNMAIKREALTKIGGLDTSLKTFEDVDTVQSICEAGYKMILDPKMYVWHKHRQTLRGILKQTHAYGMGGPKFRKKHPKSKIAKFYRVGLTAFYIFMLILALGLAASLTTGNLTPLLAAFSPFIIGYLAGFAYYAWKGNGLKASLLYPMIDALRIFAFCIGDLKASLREAKKENTLSSRFPTNSKAYR